MPSRLDDAEDYELVNRNSSESDETFSLDEADFQSHGSTTYAKSEPLNKKLQNVISGLLPARLRRTAYHRLARQKPQKVSVFIRRGQCRPTRRTCFWLHVWLGIATAFTVLTAVFNPSYTYTPKHYQELRRTIEASEDYGRGNPENQKVFIAASIYDKGGHLLGGAWGEALLKLIDILGNRNVFLSIYENDSGIESLTAKINLEQRVQCKRRFEYDKNFSEADVPHVRLPDGSERVKRVAYLAEVRNKALEPLEDETNRVQYDKILYLNDVIFDPIEAAQLILATNLDEHGHTSYRAACAVDFINPFKFYDTFATRDAEGYSMGVPFFPWFTSSGNGISRQDVLKGKDAVRVKSCWGGMVAFDAKPFQTAKPLRFRASTDLYWEASECCLIHADLVKQDVSGDDGNMPGVYMNPFIRVAYSQRTLRWLQFTRRFERLYAIPHSVINRLAGLPWFNPRRTEEAGQNVQEKGWVSDSGLVEGGSFQMQEREAIGDGFCGRRGLQLIVEAPRKGEKNWEDVPVPSG